MGEFLITLQPKLGGNPGETKNDIHVCLWDSTDLWSEEVPLKLAMNFDLSNLKISNAAQTHRVEVPGRDRLPEWINIRIDGHDLLTVDWVSVARAPGAGEAMSADTVAIFDLGTDGHNFSRDKAEGDSEAMFKATDISGPSGVWGDYLILVETGDRNADDSTNSKVELQFYDLDAKQIGGVYNMAADMHDGKQEFWFGTIATVNATLPSPNWNRGAENPPPPIFVDVTIKGGDAWNCERIWVLRRKSGDDDVGRTTLSRFEIGRTLSTDSSEGVTTITSEAQGYEIVNAGQSTATRTAVTYAVFNGAGLAEAGSPVTVEIERGFSKSISLSQASGSKNSHSISIGATVGYNPPSATGGVSAKVTSTYNQGWERWKSMTGVALYDESKSEKNTATLNAPAHTIRLGRWEVTHTVKTFQVSNGFGDAVGLELVPADGLVVPSPTQVDINKENKISRADWAKWKTNLEGKDSVTPGKSSDVERDIEDRGWFSD